MFNTFRRFTFGYPADILQMLEYFETMIKKGFNKCPSKAKWNRQRAIPNVTPSRIIHPVLSIHGKLVQSALASQINQRHHLGPSATKCTTSIKHFAAANDAKWPHLLVF